MSNLLKADIYILFKSKAFYICLIVLAIFSIAMPYLYKIAQNELDNLSVQDKEILQQIKEAVPEGTQGLSVGFTTSAIDVKKEIEPNVTWFIGQILAGGALLFVLAIFISNTLLTEMLFGTIRNSVAKGFSRTKIYLSKWITMIIATLIFLFVMIITEIISTMLMYGISPITQECLRIIGIEALLYVAMVSIFTMVGMIFHKKVLVVVTNILIVMVGSNLLAAISMLFRNSVTLTKYWIPSNITEMGEVLVENQDVIRCIICAILYIVITLTIGIYTFKRKDIR